MKRVAYCHPLIPPEWIAAHGLRPDWLRPRGVGSGPRAGSQRGVCPYAGAVVDALQAESGASAAVLVTACDQMRYAAALAARQRGDLPIFLMNVPSTWQTATARQLYLEELRRLGRFLVGLGGNHPSEDELASVMLEYDRARREVRAARGRVPARRFAESLAEIRSGDVPVLTGTDGSPPAAGCPLALLGGPLTLEDYAIFDLIEQAGGRVVLDATEAGERTMPAALDRRRTREDPPGALVDAYFGSIVDVYQRPNTPLYEWLQLEIGTRGVRGILLRRYLWCDLWHAELFRLKERSRVPVLELDVAGGDGSSRSRTLNRLEAFLEMLR